MPWSDWVEMGYLDDWVPPNLDTEIVPGAATVGFRSYFPAHSLVLRDIPGYTNLFDPEPGEPGGGHYYGTSPLTQIEDHFHAPPDRTQPKQLADDFQRVVDEDGNFAPYIEQTRTVSSGSYLSESYYNDHVGYYDNYGPSGPEGRQIVRTGYSAGVDAEVFHYQTAATFGAFDRTPVDWNPPEWQAIAAGMTLGVDYDVVPGKSVNGPIDYRYGNPYIQLENEFLYGNADNSRNQFIRWYPWSFTYRGRGASSGDIVVADTCSLFVNVYERIDETDGNWRNQLGHPSDSQVSTLAPGRVFERTWDLPMANRAQRFTLVPILSTHLLGSRIPSRAMPETEQWSQNQYKLQWNLSAEIGIYDPRIVELPGDVARTRPRARWKRQRFRWWIPSGGGGDDRTSVLRLGQRDDGLGGTSAHPRLTATSHATSTQSTQSPRVGGANTYS